MATGEGRYVKLMATVAKTDVLILDDGGLATLSEANRRDWLALLEERADRRATSVTSQLPVEHWHEALGAPRLADAILDRLVPNAYKMTLRGACMRKAHGRVTSKATAASQCSLQRRCAPRVAGFAWSGWQPSRGLGGSFRVVCVATFPWSGWQESVEYAASEANRRIYIVAHGKE
jgi:hypothetical protein